MTAPTLTPLVIVEERLLLNLAANPVITGEFPFLRSLAGQKRAGCGSCGGGQASGDRAELFGAVKRQLAALTPERADRLKQLLNAAKIRIVYRDIDGKVKQREF